MILLATLASLMACQSDIKIDLTTTTKGYSYEAFEFPKGFELFNLDMQMEELKIEKPTLIQVWSTCCGADDESWTFMRNLEGKYRDKGLVTYSVNFENGVIAAQQIERLKTFLKDVKPPDKVFVDTLGDSVDQLKVTGFPTYLLVTSKGDVIYRTNGNDMDGLVLLIEEIESMLEGA